MYLEPRIIQNIPKLFSYDQLLLHSDDAPFRSTRPNLLTGWPACPTLLAPGAYENIILSLLVIRSVLLKLRICRNGRRGGDKTTEVAGDGGADEADEAEVNEVDEADEADETDDGVDNLTAVKVRWQKWRCYNICSSSRLYI